MPSVCQIVMMATPKSARFGLSRIGGLRIDAYPGQQSDHRVEQRPEDDCGNGNRGRDRRREDRPVDADAAQLLVREHREQQAEDDARRHRQQREADRGLQAVDEVLGAEDVPILVEADVVLRQPGERRRLVEAQVEVAEERIEDEDAEDEQRRQDQQVREPDLASAAASEPLAPLPRRPLQELFGLAHVRDRPERARVAGEASCGSMRRSVWASKRCRWSRSVARRTIDPSPGAGLGRLLAHDHHLPVLEPADHVPLVAERLDHRHGRGQQSLARRAGGARAGRRRRHP